MATSLTGLRHRIRQEMSVSLGARPRLYFALQRARGEMAGRSLVDKETHLVIEGFPRSGNTFSLVAFESAQPRPLRVAHHYHMPAQVLRGVTLGIPVLVLIRDPEDAVLSLMVRNPDIGPQTALRHYTRFYRTVSKVGGGFVLGEFDQVVSNFGEVTRALNQQFDSDFGVFEHTDENVAACFERIEELDRADRRKTGTDERSVARPSPGRDELTARARSALAGPSVARALSEARDLHRSVVASARP